MTADMKDWLKELSKDAPVDKAAQPWLETGYTYDELKTADLPDPEWFIKGFIPNPALIAMTGRPGHFKTFFTQWITMRLAAGMNAFDQWDNAPPVGMDEKYKEPLGVVFIEEEMNARQLKERANDMRSWPMAQFHWFISAGFSLRDKKKVAELRKFVEDNNIRILVLDPFTTVAEMKDENSNSEAREVMDVIRHQFVDTDHACTVIFIHHPAKGEHGDSIRGAGDILGKCDMHYVVEKVGDGADVRKIKVMCKKSRYKYPEDFIVEMVHNEKDLGRLQWEYRGTTVEKYIEERDELKDQLDKAMVVGEIYGQSEAAALVGQKHNNKRFRKVWGQLIEEKKVEQIGRYEWRKIA